MHTIPEVHDLTLDEQIGQCLCFGWQGATDAESLTVNAHARALVEEMRVGSVVLLGRNCGTPEQTRAALAELQSLSPVPLFIAIDQEGGMVNRFRPPHAPLTEFPGNMALGAVQPPERAEDLAYRQAEAQARELRAIGINWNFAPVCDVNCNPDNPIIGVRSYGEDPALVARLATAATRGLQDNGVLACAKHFPGHGDTSVDSHLALPTVTGDRARMDAVELLPFRAVISEGVGAVMTTHILFPALDPDRPATMSRAVLTNLLRKELGYTGVVITDCLEMEAIASTVGTPRGALESLKAGADVVLVCHTLETQRETVRVIRESVTTGELPSERVAEAAGRVLDAKRRFLAAPPPEDSAPWLDPAHAALEQEIARGSISFMRTTGALPLSLRAEDRLLLFSAHPAVVPFHAAVHRRHPNTALYHVDPSLRAGLELSLRELLEGADHAVLLTCPPEPWSDKPIHQRRQAILAKLFAALLGNRLTVVAIRNPYDIRRFPQVPNYVCTYGYRPASLEALAAALFGEFQPTGKLPVTIPSLE
jgi:beta-N-acetylhexosaminidase